MICLKRIQSTLTVSKQIPCQAGPYTPIDRIVKKPASIIF